MNKSEIAAQAQNTESKIPWKWWQGLLGGFLVYFVAIFVSSFVAALILPKTASDLLFAIFVYTLSSVALVISAGGFLRLYKLKWRNFFGTFHINDIGYLPLFYGAYFLLTYVVQTLLSQVPSYNADQSQSFGLEGASGPALIGVLLVLVILPPIAEEIVFRGIIYRGMAARWGRVIAALLTSALFGLAHGQWNVAADTFVLSLVLIAALETTKSLYLPIAVHMLKNLIAYVLVFVLLK